MARASQPAFRSAARSLALRARRFSAISSCVGQNWAPRQYVETLVVAEGLLHDAIFQRMKADRNDASGAAQTSDRTEHSFAQSIELVVDGDAQRLKDARRGMDPFAPSRATDDAGNELGELGGRARQRAVRAARDDRRGRCAARDRSSP